MDIEKFMTPEIVGLAALSGLFIVFVVGIYSFVQLERRHRARMRRIDELGARAAKGDTKAVVELIEGLQRTRK